MARFFHCLAIFGLKTDQSKLAASHSKPILPEASYIDNCHSELGLSLWQGGRFMFFLSFFSFFQKPLCKYILS